MQPLKLAYCSKIESQRSLVSCKPRAFRDLDWTKTSNAEKTGDFLLEIDPHKGAEPDKKLTLLKR